MIASKMLHAFQNPSQAGEDGGSSLSFPVILLCYVKRCYFTQLFSSNGLEWCGRAVGMTELDSEQCTALQFL